MATVDNYTVNINVKGDQDLKNASASASNLGKSLGDLSSGPLKGITNIFGDGANIIQNFGDKMSGLSDKANQLALAIVGIGMAEYIHKIAEAASQTKDLSEAFGLQISTVLELQAGFQKAGRDADAMSKMMTTLNLKALEAADGSLKVKNAFADLGVSFNDLKTLSMDQIMLKIGKAMEEGKGSATSIAAAMEVLGKSAKGVPWGDFVEGLERAQGKMGDAAHGVEEFDKAMKQMEQNAADVRREFMVLITPVVEFFNKVMEGSGHAKEAAVALAGAMTAIAGVAVIKSITALYDVLKGLATMLGLTTVETAAETAALVANSTAQAANAATRTAGLAAKVASLNATVMEARATLENAAATGAETAAKVVLERTEWRLAAAKAALAEASAVEAAMMGRAAVATGAAATAATAATPAVTGLAGAVGVLGTALARFAPLLTAAAAAFAIFYSGDLNKGEDEQLKEIKKLQDALASLPKEQQEAYFRMSAEEQKRVAEAVKNGKAIREAMASATGGGTKPGDKPVLDENKKELDQQAATRAGLLAQYEVQVLQRVQAEKRLQLQAELIGMGEVEKTQKLAAFDAEQKKQMEILRLQQQIHVMEVQAANDPEGAAKYAGQLTIMRNQLQIVSQQVDKTAELTAKLKEAEIAQQKYLFGTQLSEKAMTEMISIQDQINQLTMTGDQQRMASLQQRIQAEARAEIKRREALLGNGQKLDWVEQIEILHQVEAAYDPIIRKQQELTEKSRDFQTGWSKAYNAYMDDATNAAKRGETVFNNMTNRMNSAIDNFVETGKFSFSDFARSVIQDLLKIELKAQANKLLGMTGGGGGGLFSWIGSMLGFADGGDPPVGKPSIVGENGPEVFIPKTAGTIIPNDKIGGASPVVNNTYITNEISAIDAKGVAQLFAENRKVLLGSVQMAQKEMPYGNR